MGNMKKKGETLIEGLISMLIVGISIVPISHILIQTMKTNIKLGNKVSRVEVVKNMIELIKTKDFKDIVELKGKHSINDINEFYEKFRIEEKYRILEGNYDGNMFINLEIIKGNKIKIKIDEVEDIYKIK